MTLTRTRDLALVHAMVTAPGSWEAATDDSAPHSDEWEPNADERIVYLLARDAAGPIGLYTLLPQNEICWEIHTTAAFGRRAAGALKAACQWAAKNTPARRIVASIPATNRIAIRHAKQCGFEQYGRNPASLLKHGKVIDQILLGRAAD